MNDDAVLAIEIRSFIGHSRSRSFLDTTSSQASAD
jgi:hypothetical protein